MPDSLSSSALKVQQALAARGFPLQVVELPASTRTAVEAAQAIGCHVGQIAKSLVFRGKESGKAYLIVASGKNRVDLQRAGRALGEALEKADAAFVRQQTGFSIGGVPPIGHTHPLLTLIDRDLLAYEEIWAAAGTPHAVFRLTPQVLVEMTAGEVTSISSS